MPASNLVEFDASDVDARVNAGVAVLAMVTDRGRVAVSMTPEVLERLALRIQLELARHPVAAARAPSSQPPSEHPDGSAEQFDAIIANLGSGRQSPR